MLRWSFNRLNFVDLRPQGRDAERCRAPQLAAKSIELGSYKRSKHHSSMCNDRIWIILASLDSAQFIVQLTHRSILAYVVTNYWAAGAAMRSQNLRFGGCRAALPIDERSLGRVHRLNLRPLAVKSNFFKKLPGRPLLKLMKTLTRIDLKVILLLFS